MNFKRYYSSDYLNFLYFIKISIFTIKYSFNYKKRKKKTKKKTKCEIKTKGERKTIK
jgi:hypothetical protein